MFEFAGGEPAFLALAAAHHRRCLEDPVLSHPFSNLGNPQHVERLAWYWAEVLGGPKRYSESCGGHPAMLGIHAGQGAEDDLGARFVACFVHAADDAGLPDSPEFRAGLRAYMEWAVAEVLSYSPPETQVAAGLSMPRWGWNGLEQSNTTLYDRTYGASQNDLTRVIRLAAFGEDIGQLSWTTADEHRRFQRLLRVDAASYVLDVACGSGGPSLHLVRSTGCRVVGVDIHEAGVLAANEAAAREGIADRARFLVHDAREPFPFDDETFDAIISIDSINHVFSRGPMFAEWYRVLRQGGRVLYTDAVVVTGPLLREEILARSSSMGEFVFTPYGADEPLLRAAGFVDIRMDDVTDNVITVSGNWHAARDRLAGELDESEGAEANAEFQNFLATVHRLATDRRLSRLAYTARKGV